MILIDANLLIYAYDDSFRQHGAARAWLDEKLNGSSPAALPWPSLLAFVRLVADPRVFERPVSVVEAWKQAEAWLDCPASWVPVPTERHREFLARFLNGSGLRSSHVPDAHLAALAMEHDLTLCSTDGDFARFPGLRWQNPLV